MAATFYNMLTGKYPLDFPQNRDPIEVILRDEPIALAVRDRSVSPAVAAVVDRALAVRPENRYASAAEIREIREALRQALPPA